MSTRSRAPAATFATPRALTTHLRREFGVDMVLEDVPAHYLRDATEARGLHGRADAVVLPASADDVARVLAWCYERDVPVTPRGGGTGFAGGAVPTQGGVVLALERLARIRSFEPLLWRIEVEAGTRTAALRRRCRESGLLFPPDPGAGEQSQIGGNVATNAGGPHAFKYGVTGAWVTGLEAVVPPGEIVRIGGPVRKDVAGYDLKHLLVGSEGTLGIVTSVWLRLLPAPEASYPIVAFYPDARTGCNAIEQVLGYGLPVAALEFLDTSTFAAGSTTFPGQRHDEAFAVIVDVDGSRDEALRLRAEACDCLAEDALGQYAPTETRAIESLWQWRDGVSLAVQAQLGGKVSEDVAVPVERLSEVIRQTVVIGERHGLVGCSWGHAGDGNVHTTFMLDAADVASVDRAERAAEEVFELAISLGGSISGEHGVGLVKGGWLERQWDAAAVRLERAIKDAFDPKGLLNPGKKL